MGDFRIRRLIAMPSRDFRTVVGAGKDLHAASAAGREGFILITVLWLLAALASLTVIASVYIVQSTRCLLYTSDAADE